MQKSNSKKTRRSPHAGRVRGAQTRTGHRAGPKAPHASEVAKILMGGGMLDTTKVANPAKPWLGVGLIRKPFDAAQAALNRTLYPHLFAESR